MNDSAKYVGNGSLEAPITNRMDITTFGTDADSADCLAIQFTPDVMKGGVPTSYPVGATVEVDADGGTSAALITLTVKTRSYESNSDVDVAFTIDCGVSAKVPWSAGAASAYTLKEVIDLINDVDAGGTNGKLLAGFKAWALHAPHDMPVNVADMFIDGAAEYVMTGSGTSGYTGFLKRDMAVHSIDSDYLAYLRIGLPEVRDRGLMRLIDIYGAIGTDTGCTVRIYQDDIADYVSPSGTYATDIANHATFFNVAAANISANTGTTPGYANDIDKAMILRGPCILEVKGDTDTAQTVNLALITQQVL